MPFEQGQSGNPAGRPKGSVNKTSKELREMITNFLVENFEEVQKCFDTLKPKEKIKVYCDLLAFAVPKLKPLNDDILDRLSEQELIDLFEKLKKSVDEPIQDAKAET